ncbi:MAG: phosphoribosylformylglycinamidine cyclo-ligase [Chloroflexi bacterium]|nr:phosphoribosylformylglycinamidine cyclo-ligase [Chloroflexota bacterium]MCH8892554.1 phosphoribosylformylglycinamidine cyclo-ligase [Chloroflexota bacterium]MCI0897320.1 phosphoribosylformylglycinamidine cyclo-ligase [Chloroflexota bacterium]MCI0902631.1 phosphoribosylformylglycinamidine cyclo-ligase [Chloroflexota bacterium]
MASEAYRESGVDLDRMDGLKERIKGFAATTHGPEVLDSSGSFAGLYQLSGYREPVLVASTDGVGTKIKIAAQLGHFESVGQDLVTLNVNDILTKGAKPLFFLDYVAFSKLDTQRLDNLMRGITWGCRETGCALIGGETAQMPQVYSGDEMDLAGFVVGAVERDQLLEPHNVEAGDILVGVPSSGLHTNGFSLVRRVFNTDGNPNVLYRRFDELNHQLGEELLVPHRSYYPLMEPVLRLVTGLAHITGGGLPGKLPAVFPDNLAAEITRGSWPVLPIFKIIQAEGGISDQEMYRVFNMGLGMVAVCPEANVAKVLECLPDAVVIGKMIARGEGEQVVFSG